MSSSGHSLWTPRLRSALPCWYGYPLALWAQATRLHGDSPSAGQQAEQAGKASWWPCGHRPPFGPLYCRLVLAESLPQDLPYAAGSPSAQSLAQAWLQLLDTAQESIHVASYYWSLTGSDIGVNDSSSQPVRP